MLPIVGAFLRWSCLKPTYKLQRQVAFSYGGTAVLTLVVMILCSILAARRAGQVVQQQARDMLVQQVISSLQETGDATADVLSERVIQRLSSTTALVNAMVRDRIVGYNYPGDGNLGGVLGGESSSSGSSSGSNSPLRQLQEEWYHDVNVPFRNSDYVPGTTTTTTTTNGETISFPNQYPLHATKRRPATSSRPFLPLDWNITLNVIQEDEKGKNSNNNNNNNNNDESRNHSSSTSTIQEHLVYPERVTLFKELNLLSKISTASASFRFPGICNPYKNNNNNNNNNNEEDTTSCTPESNNITSGGSLYPVPSTRYIYEKAADLSIMLKALWESDPAILSIAIHFHNLGVGASVRFPGQMMDRGTHHNTNDNNDNNNNNQEEDDSYISIGCDWMLSTMNPYTERPLYTVSTSSTWPGSGSPSGPASVSGSSSSSSSSSSQSSSSSPLSTLLPNCHAAGTVVSYREYNPLERPYCRDQARHPGQVRMFGPHLDTKLNIWRLTFGQAIFDASTGNFIGCTAVDVSPQSLTMLLEELSVDSNRNFLNNTRTLALTRLDGMVVAGAGWDSRTADSLLHWSDTPAMKQEDPTTFDQLAGIILQLIGYNNNDDEEEDGGENTKHQVPHDWDAAKIRQGIQNNMQTLSDGTVVFAQPIPTIPNTNKDDDLNDPYEPKLFMFSSAGGDLLTAVDDMKQEIEKDVRALIMYTMVIGISGLVAILVAVWLVSILLTTPLQWMEEVAWRIVNHSDERAGEELREVAERRGIEIEEAEQQQNQKLEKEKKKEKEQAEEDNDETSSNQEDVAPAPENPKNNNSNNNRGSNLRALGGSGGRKLTTRFTPRTEITELVSEFQSMIQGFSGKGAGKVANPLHHEVKNCLTWQHEFQQLYDRTGGDDTNRMADNTGSNNGAGGAGGKSNTRMSFARRLSTSHRRPSTCERRESFARRLSDHRENSTNQSSRSMDRDWRELLGSCVDDDDDDDDEKNGPGVGVVKSSSDKEGNKNDHASTVEDHPRVKEEEGSKDATTTTSDGHGVPEHRRSPVNFRESFTAKDEDSAHFRSAEQVLRMSASLPRPAISVSSASYAESRNSVSELVSKIKFESDSRFESTFSQDEQRMNRGSNLWDCAPSGDVSVASGESNTFHRGGHVDRIKPFNILDKNPVKISRSSLFRWIVGLIAVPLLLTNVLICCLVARDILREFPGWVELSRTASLEFELESLRNLVYLRSMYAEHELAGPIRDLFLVTRLAGWLLFDAIDRSDSFSTLETEFLEECKVYPDDETCPFFADDSRSPCDCKWNDPWTQQCTNFDDDTRPIQQAYFLGQARDADNVTGNRVKASSFPTYDYSPETTLWWNNISELPGAYKGRNAAGYETTYDRVRVISALAVVSMPVYNYATTARSLNNHTAKSSNVFFEMDGSVWGYSGCYDAYGGSAHFQSSDNNRAYLIKPDLCPRGKFGYDGRCRSFYEDGKRTAMEEGDPIHMTEPYRYAIGNPDIGSSALCPLIDPRNGTLVGQTLVDFSPAGMIRALDRTRSYFYTVISTRASDTSDTVAGPDHAVGDDPASITNVVLPNDLAESTNLKTFSGSVLQMKQGKRGDVDFHRKNVDGREERIRLAYAPVHALGLSPVRADDFTQGVRVKKVLLYSLGVARLEEIFTSPFDKSGDDIKEALGRVGLAYLLFVGLLSVLCMAFTAKISIAVTKPMIILLRVVQNVNAGHVEDDIPPLIGGSREVNQVYSSFAKLHKIVRVSNSAFFTGNLKWAYDIAHDALLLFQKVDDEKAVGIARNNIGNTLFAMSLGQPLGGTCNMVEGKCCVELAIENYNEAIRIGMQDFEADNPDDVKTDFACPLADRFFNRGMFLLHAAGHECAPLDARVHGYNDLAQARALDGGVREFWLVNKLLLKNSGIVFDRLIRRLNGLAAMRLVDEDIWQFWNVNDLVDEADLMLTTAWKHTTAPLFHAIDRVGRLQQLEGVVMQLEMNSGRTEEAALLGMRMLVEDEYILDSAVVVACEALLRFQRSPLEPWSRKSLAVSRKEIRKMLKNCKNCHLDTGKSVVFCFELGERWEEDHTVLEALNKGCLSIYDDKCSIDDFNGVVAINENGGEPEIVDMGRNDELSEQRNAINLATQVSDGTRTIPAFPAAVDMILESAITMSSDTFLLYITDGRTWDANLFYQRKVNIEKVNSKRGMKIHVIAIGLEIEDQDIVEQIQRLVGGIRDSLSTYLEARRESLGSVLKRAGEMISSRGTNRVELGVTMEKF